MIASSTHEALKDAKNLPNLEIELNMKRLYHDFQRLGSVTLFYPADPDYVIPDPSDNKLKSKISKQKIYQ